MTDEPLLGKRGRRVALALGLVGGLLLVIVLGAVVTSATKSTQIRDTQLEGTPTGRKLVASADRTLDCSEPTGECYKRNQKRLVEVIADIGAANILTVVCALNVPDGTPIDRAVEQVSKCVADRLAKPDRKP